MEDPNRILCEIDVHDLQNQGLVRPGPIPRTHRIHKRRLNSASESEYSALPLDSDDSGNNDIFATIPESLISRETLIYVGHSAARASELWNAWQSWPATGPRRETDPDGGLGFVVTFDDFFLYHLDSAVKDDASIDDDAAWEQCLNECGIDVSTSEAIMEPACKDIRLTETCLFWVKDTMQMRFAGLREIQRASRERAIELATSAASGSSSSRHSISGMQQQAMRGMRGISASPWNENIAKTATSNKPNHLLLFKCMDQGRLAGFFDRNGNIEDVEKLVSLPRTDFSSKRSLYYFTPDVRVAECYAAYAKRRANCESVVMVCLSIPHSAMDSIPEENVQRLYWPSPDWKQLVWRSRMGKPLPRPLRKYRDKLLLIGTTSRGNKCTLEAMSTWEEMTADCVLYMDEEGRNRPAIQYAFSGEEEGGEFLQDNGTFDVYPFGEEQLRLALARTNYDEEATDYERKISVCHVHL